MAADRADTPASEEVNTKNDALHLEKSFENADDLETQIQSVSQEEHNKIFRKVDIRLMPMLMALYLVANLDRSASPQLRTEISLTSGQSQHRERQDRRPRS